MDQAARPNATPRAAHGGTGWRRLDGPTLHSGDACRLALEAYERAFRLCRELEPDVGFAERYATGRRSLDARGRANPWELPADRAGAVAMLLDEIRRAPAHEAGDWVDRFPRAFLGILERRTGPGTLPDAYGRRFGERVKAPEPAART